MTELYYQDRPDGAISGLLYDYELRVSAVGRHAAAEGATTTTTHRVLDSYDRTLHPWMHNRRPADIARRLHEWLL